MWIRAFFLKFLLLGVLGLAGIVSPAVAAPGGMSRPPIPFPLWRNEIVAPGVSFAELGAPGVGLDPDGNPHVVYGRNRLFHSWFDGTIWQRETVNSAHGSTCGPVLAIDDLGTITAVVCPLYYSDRGGLIEIYTLPRGGLWQVTELWLPGLQSVGHLTLALDKHGQAHIVVATAFYDQKPHLIYAHSYAHPTHTTSMDWSIELIEVELSAGGPISLALDSQDRPVVLYSGSDAEDFRDILWLTRFDENGWQHHQITTGDIIVGKSLALDAQDKVQAVFSDHGDGQFTYVRETEEEWEVLPVGDNGVEPSLALDESGRPHIVYYSHPVGQIYAVLGNKGWQQTIVQEGEYAGYSNTLLLDKAGAAHILSLKVVHTLYYATNSGGQWMIEQVAGQEPVGARNALALDSADRPHLLFYEPSAKELRWAVRDGTDWQTSFVATVEPAGLELALAIGADDAAYIAYVNEASNQLVVGTQQAGEWSLEPIAAGGRNLALAIGSDNRPQLILIQNQQLIYWRKEGEAWLSEPVGVAGGPYWNAKLALDSQDRPHIAYEVGGGAFLATRHGIADWTAELLPFNNLRALALGPEDKAYLLHTEYRDEPGKPPIYYASLFLAEWDASGWSSTLLLEELIGSLDADIVGQLAIDAANHLHIVYRNTYGTTIYQRRDGDSLFEIPTIGNAGDFSLTLGKDGEPRISNHSGSDLLLATREILWLDRFMLLPVVSP